MLLHPLLHLGWSDRWAEPFAEAARPGDEPGRVVRHDGSALLVATASGTLSVPIRPGLEPATVGDWVVLGDGALRSVLPRTSQIGRRDPGPGTEQLMAANVDVVVIVCGLDRPVKSGRISRTAALAWDAGAMPVVVLTKADLLPDAVAAGEQVALANPGVAVILTSTADGAGLDALAALARDRTIVLVGESGAGKSSLANALLGTDAAMVGSVRHGDAKGRHTTTARQLFPLPGGGALIDSPGIRAVGLSGGAEGVDVVFSDVADLAGGCRFTDCTHDSEPGCAVVAAVETGGLPAARLDSWRSLRREAVAAERRASEHDRRRYEKRFSRAAKDAQRRKGRG